MAGFLYNPQAAYDPLIHFFFLIEERFIIIEHLYKM